MRIGIKGESLMEKLVVGAGMLPEMSFLPFMTCIVSESLTTAQRLGIFDVLHKSETKKLSAQDVATKIECDVHGVQVLLEALVSFGYLERQRDRNDHTFQLSDKFLKEIEGDKGAAALSLVKFSGDLGKRFHSLEEEVRTGRVENFHHHPISPETCTNYQGFLVGYSEDFVQDMVGRVKFSTPPTKMLDIAGGPAQYSLAFCRKYPRLTSTILDLPSAEEAGSQQVAKANLTERVSYQVGDFFQTSWGEPATYHFTLASNILHCLKPEQNRELITKAFESLKSGGTIVINEPYFPGADEDLEYMSGMTSLLYFALMGTRTYPSPTIQAWLKDAGFVEVAMSRFRTAAITVGKKP